VIRFNHPTAISALEAIAGVRFHHGVHQCLARYQDGEFMGGIIYTDFNHASIQMHVGSIHPRWIDRAILWMAFDFPFNKLGVKKIFGTIKESNRKALDFDLKLGFNLEARITDVYPDGEAMLVVAMYRDECRFLKQRPPRRVTIEGKQYG
jgi:RimJ/RimL family protein N-acetyltransferase